MPDFHPIQALKPIVFHFPRPGTKEPFAIIQWVDVVLEGEPVSRWRAVTYKEPRRLILDGYYRELEDAAMACNKIAIANMVPAALNDTGLHAHDVFRPTSESTVAPKLGAP